MKRETHRPQNQRGNQGDPKEMPTETKKDKEEEQPPTTTTTRMT